MSERQEIPDGVAKLLRHPWSSADGRSAFEVVREIAKERWRDPSFYFSRKDHGPANALDYEDMAGLVAVPELSGLVGDRGDHCVMNEHAEHALSDFCSAVYDEWEKCRSRLAEIPLTKPIDPAIGGDDRG